MPFTLSDILTATHGRLTQAGFSTVDALSIETDSRQVAGSSVFWALPGERFDGHDFVHQAIERGATACVVQAGHHLDIPKGCSVIEVENSLSALADLARWHRLRLGTPVIGVTGSFGKTTTRELVSAVLSARFRVFQSPKNFNNDVGLPLCLFGLKPEHDVAVLELGASAVGDIRRLCSVALPNFGIITGIGRAHSESFGGVKKTRAAKAELVECLPTDGRAFLPFDDAERNFLASKSACSVTFVSSQATNQEGVLTAQHITARDGMIEFNIGWQPFVFRAAGSHFVRNALFAIAVGRQLGMTDAEIAAGLARFEPVAGRCEIKQFGSWTVIDDTYNASPEAMIAACRTLSQWPTNGRRVLITGDMLALGDDAIDGHQDVGIAAAEARLDLVLSLGEHADDVIETAREAGLCPDRSAAFSEIEPLLHRLKEELQDGDVVLVKGSRGMRMERVVEWLAARAKSMKPAPAAQRESLVSPSLATK